jgi:hypothetical protein
MAAPSPKYTYWDPRRFNPNIFPPADLHPFPPPVVPVSIYPGVCIDEALKTPCTIPYDMSGVPLPPAPTK